MLSPKIIALEDGWNNEIKAKAIDVLEGMLNTGLEKDKPRLFDPKEYVQTYTTCYNMCTQRSPYNWSEQLYQRHGETICDYLSKTVLPALKTKRENFLLTELTVRWANHKVMNKWMRLFFMYLDRYYVKHHSLPTLDVAGLKHFKTLVYNEVKKDVVNAMIALIDAERDQALIDRALVKNTVELLEAMGMSSLDAYVTDFEDQLLTSTKEYYARKSQEWVESDDAPAYLAKAEVALEAEAARVAHYLNGASEPKLLRVCEHEILELRETVLLEKEGSGCRALLANDRKADLARMYRLFGRVPNTPTHGLPPMAALVRAHIEQMGNEIIDRREARLSEGAKDSNQDPGFVKELLALHDKYLAVVSEQFDGNALFQKALKEAFVEFANRDVGKHTNAELMSSFCDRILKSGGEKLGDEDVEAFLEKTVQLFSYLTDKDLFAEIYRNQLAKRLLNQRSASDDAERLMIGKLKLRCGSQFTGKMEGMLNDLAIGHDHQADFDTYVKADEARSTGKLDFSVQVLTTGYWPTFASIDAHLPSEIVQCTKVFRDCYDDKNSKRRVTWMWSLGNASVKAFFGKKAYDLQVATLQAIVLLTFNPVDGASQTLTYAQVSERVNLPDEHLKRVLHSLACGQYKVLAKTPASSRVALTDSFAVNAKFACPMRKIRVPMASLDDSHNPKRVEENRTVAIEAAIVRIMKARKALSHQSLLAEVAGEEGVVAAILDAAERDPEIATACRYLA